MEKAASNKVAYFKDNFILQDGYLPLWILFIFFIWLVENPRQQQEDAGVLPVQKSSTAKKVVIKV